MYERKEQEAIPQFQRALSLNPNRYLSWMNLAICYRRTNHAAESGAANRKGLGAVEKELARDPRSGYLRSMLAYLCARLGDRMRAESEVEQAVRLSPNDSDTLFMAATTYAALGQGDSLWPCWDSTQHVNKDFNRWPDVANGTGTRVRSDSSRNISERTRRTACSQFGGASLASFEVDGAIGPALSP